MGGSGSGRWWRYHSRDTVESCRRLDVRDWQRRGLLRPWQGFSWAWWRDGEHVADIHVKTEPSRVVLRYRVRRPGENWQDVEEPAALTWTRCHFGGQRPWFVCQGVVNGRYCGRRVAILYGAGVYFLCRRCYGLAYESQQEDRAGRLLLKAQRTWARLGGGGLPDCPPLKPKGMHRRTYERLRRPKGEPDPHNLRTIKRGGSVPPLATI